jgi:hypothetical protein
VVPAPKQFKRMLTARLVAVLLLAVGPASAHEVADIPFFSAPPGSSALGGGLRLGQSLFRETDNEEQLLLECTRLSSISSSA